MFVSMTIFFFGGGICCSPTHLFFRVRSSLMLALRKSEFYLLSDNIYSPYFSSTAVH